MNPRPFEAIRALAEAAAAADPDLDPGLTHAGTCHTWHAPCLGRKILDLLPHAASLTGHELVRAELALDLDAGDPLRVFAPGRPKPKGSLRHVGGGRMVEQVAGSAPWRFHVATTAHTAIESTSWPTARPGPMEVDILCGFPRPRTIPAGRVAWPITRSTGDADKLARNICDALTDAGVFGDDSQVVDLHIRKRYLPAGSLPEPGALIQIRPLGEEDL